MLLITDEILGHYKRCHRRGFLDFYGDKSQQKSTTDFAFKLKQKKVIFTQEVLENSGLSYRQPRYLAQDSNNLSELELLTREMMHQGVDCIQGGVIKQEMVYSSGELITFMASPTLLVKQNISSFWGDWSYYPVNIYLGKNIKSHHKLMTTFHGDILSKIQRIKITKGIILLKGKNNYNYVDFSIWQPRLQGLIDDFISTVKCQQIPDVFISRHKCGFCPWQGNCYTEAKQIQHLSLIPTINQKKYEVLLKNNITNLSTLALTSFPKLREIFPSHIAQEIFKQTYSISHQKPVLKSSYFPFIPTQPIEFFFDIEADGDRNLDFLLGVLWVNNETKEKKYYGFLARNEEEEGKIWQEFLKLINEYPEGIIYHFSNYEKETIQRLGYVYKTNYQQLKEITNRLVDLHKHITKYFFLPLENYSLKTIGNWMGFQWRDVTTKKPSAKGINVSGDQCVVWYDLWLKTSDSGWLDYILIYNEDDCYGTYKLKKWLTEYQEKKDFLTINPIDV